MTYFTNNQLVLYVTGELPDNEAREIGEQLASDDDLTARIALLDILGATAPMEEVVGTLAPESKIFELSETQIQEEIRRAAEQFRDASGNWRQVPNWKIVDAAYRRLCYRKRVRRNLRLFFFEAAGKAISSLILERARRESSHDASTVAMRRATESTMGMFGDEPSQVLAKHRGIERLTGIEPGHARIYVLADFAGRSATEIAELVSQPLDEVQAILESAAVEVELAGADDRGP